MIDNLRHLDETSDKLLKRGHIREAIDCIDLALERRKELLGPGSHAFNLSCLNSAATFMNIAMDQTHNMNTKSRVSLLSRAEELSQSSDSSKITVWYNIAILYQSENKLKLAYKYLKMALASQSRLDKIGDRRISIDMHLIMSSVLSQLKKHKMALRHARIALTLVKGCITEEQKQQISSTENVDGREESMDWMISFDNLSRNWLEILAISYYNIGSQYEHLKDLQASSHAYEYGTKAATLLRDDNGIRRKLEVANKYLKTRTMDDEATNVD